MPFAILDLIKVAYSNFFVVRYENKKASLDSYDKVVRRKDYNAKEERKNVAILSLHYWSLAKKVVTKPDNTKNNEVSEDKDDFKKPTSIIKDLSETNETTNNT